MKLEDYLPEVPEMVKGLGDISNTLEWLNLSKGYNDASASSESGRTPTLGIETVVNRISTEHHPLSGRAKDAGSAAVFISAVNMAVVWSFILFDLIFNNS